MLARLIIVLASATPDWGDVPTWIGGIGTCVGVVFAGIAGVIAYLLYVKETRRDERADDERRVRAEEARRQQAAQVCCWYGSAPMKLQTTTVRAWGAIMLNASTLPVYDVKVEFYFSAPHVNNGAPAGPRGYAEKEIVTPGEVYLRPPESMLNDVEDKRFYVVAVTFRDAAGHRWRRELDGRLTPVVPAQRLHENPLPTITSLTE